jgi:poly(3-hydroxyalkanoate) synthetase
MAKAVAVPADTALWAHETTNRKPPKWNSRNEVVLAAPFALLRDFSVGDDDVVPTLVFPPLAGHASCIIDKKGQSQLQLCITMGLTKLYSFDWLSATIATKDTTEADRLDFITSAVDLIAGPEGTVNIAGDCQGGWEAALWAALHPGRVNTLIVAGAPIDTSAGDGPAKKLMPILMPRGNMALYKAMVKAYGGIWPGINSVMGSIAMHPATHVAEHLKVYAHVQDREYLDHFSDFYDWYFHPIDLPGQLYLWAVEHLFVKNELFTGELEVAGKTASLRSIICPVFLLGGDEDEVTPWHQVHNMRYAVGSSLIRWYLAPGGHIGLFIGRQSQAEYWTPILAQVRQLSRPGVRGAGNNGPVSTATASSLPRADALRAARQLPRSATAGPGSPAPGRQPRSPGPRRSPAGPAATPPARSRGRSTISSATLSATSPPTPGTPAPGPGRGHLRPGPGPR